MINNVKRLFGKENYDTLKKSLWVLLIDAFFQGTVYGMMFLTLISLVDDSFNIDKVIIYTGIMLAVMLIRFFVIKKGYTDLNVGTSKAMMDLRIRMGDYIRRLYMGYFSKNNVGQLTNIVTNDLNDFEMLVTHMLPDLIKLSIITVYLSIILIVVQPVLGLIQVALFCITFPLAILAARKVYKTGREQKTVRAKMISRIIEYVRGMEVFKSYNMTGIRFAKLIDEVEKLKKASIKLELTGVPYILTITAVITVAFPIVIMLTMNQYVNTKITGEEFITFIVISLALTNIIRGLCMQIIMSLYYTISVNKLISLLDAPEVPYEFEYVDLQNYDIEFENVEFAYSDGKSVLKNLNIKLEEGTTTALVGHSGSGKTTIFNILARFWDVDSGKVTVGGMDIKKVFPDALMENISMVFQDVYLLKGTVIENIRMGKEGISREEVEAACKLAQCHDFIMEMEEGYDSMIEEGGENLSGGEKQRISIARAIIKNAPIILLDEATASLDVDNEYKIRASIREMTKNKTVVIIAHRLNTIKNSDKILVMDQGCLIEEGSHDELMALEGKYFGMINEMNKARKFKL